MRQVLTSPEGGYYTSKPETGAVFGKHGDFVTSPEISQVFGELVGVWTIAEWMSQGREFVLGRWRDRLKCMDWECVKELVSEDKWCLAFLCSETSRQYYELSGFKCLTYHVVGDGYLPPR